MKRLALRAGLGVLVAVAPAVAIAGSVQAHPHAAHLTPHLRQVRRVSIGHGVVGLQSVTDARRHRVYVASQGTMTVYETLTNRVVAVPYDGPDLFSDPSLSPATGNVYVCGTRAITVLNGDRLVARRRLPAGSSESVCAFDAKRTVFYALSAGRSGGSRLLIFKGTKRTASIALPGYTAGQDSPPAPVVDETTGDVYLGWSGDRRLLIANRHGLVKRLSLPEAPFQMAYDPRRQVVTSLGRNANLVQIRGRVIVHTVRLPRADEKLSYAGGVVVDPERNETYVVGSDNGHGVSVLSGHRLVRTIRIPSFFQAWGYDSQRDVLYAGDQVLRHGRRLGHNPVPESKTPFHRQYVDDQSDRVMLMFDDSGLYLLRATHNLQRIKLGQFDDFTAGFEPTRHRVYGIGHNQIDVFHSRKVRR